VLPVEIPEIPSFDEIVRSLLLLLGVSSPVIAIVGLLFAVNSWLGPGRMALRGAAGVGRGIRAAAQYRPVAGILSVVVTLLVPVAQLLTLPVIYIGGNYAVMQFDNGRWDEFLGVIAKIPPVESFSTLLDLHWYSVVYTTVAPFLELDRFTMGYLMTAVLIMLLSYPLAWRDSGGWTGGLGCLLAAPTMVLFALAVVIFAGAVILTVIALAAGVLALGISGEWEWPPMLEKKYWLGMLAIIVSSIAYFCACQAAVFAPGYIRAAWRKPALPDPELDPSFVRCR